MSKNPKPLVLDYVRRPRFSAWRPMSKTGLVSFGALVLWYPLNAAVFLFMWTHPQSLNGPTPTERTISMAAGIAPIAIAFIFGAWSITTTGTSRRNILGVIGFSPPTLLMLAGILELLIDFTTRLTHHHK